MSPSGPRRRGWFLSRVTLIPYGPELELWAQVLQLGQRRDRRRRITPPRLVPASAPHDLAGAPQGADEGVSKHFTSCHVF
jgi:hypothetical protein